MAVKFNGTIDRNVLISNRYCVSPSSHATSTWERSSAAPDKPYLVLSESDDSAFSCTQQSARQYLPRFLPFLFSLGWRRRWGRTLPALSPPVFWFEAVMITDIDISSALSFFFSLGSNALVKWPIAESYRAKFNSSPKPRDGVKCTRADVRCGRFNARPLSNHPLSICRVTSEAHWLTL